MTYQMVNQCAKEIMFDSLGLVDFVVRLADSFLHLPAPMGNEF